MDSTPKASEPIVARASAPLRAHRRADADLIDPPLWLELIPENLPPELMDYAQFITWQPEWREGKDGKPGKWTKVPVNPLTGRKAQSNNPRSWAPAALVLGRFSLLGFVFSSTDPYTMLDLDNAIDEHDHIKPWAADILARFPMAYWERSVSGTGLKGIVRGHVAENRGRITIADGHVEIFSTGKFTVLTGHRLPDSATTIGEGQTALDAFLAEHPRTSSTTQTKTTAEVLSLDDQVLIERVRRMQRGRVLHDDGDIALYGGDHSAADQALVNLYVLAGATDESQIDRLFRDSELMRAKWNRRDYRERTIAKALADVTPFEGWTRGEQDNARAHTVPPADPCVTERDQLAELRAEIATLKRQLAERDATIVALTQTILNPHLTHTEKVGAVNIARHADAKRQGGQVDADGCVSLSPAEVSDDWRPKPEAGEHIAPVNPDTGTVPHMPRSSARAVLDTAIERGLLTGEKRGTVRRRADNSTFKDWEYVVSPESSFADLLNPWATWRPDQPKMRKVRESRACKHCGEVHPITRVDYCGGCGGELRRQTIEQPDAGENISPIRSVAEERNGSKYFSHGADVNSEEPSWLVDAPEPWESAPQPALFAMPEPPPLDYRTDVAYGARR